MAFNDHTSLKGASIINRDWLRSNLLYGVIDFYKWGFLGIGAFQNIVADVSGAYGGNRSVLHSVTDPRFTDNTVYQGFRSDWVWETGVPFSTSPTGVKVYINDVEKTTNDATYGHYIDYLHGRVVFDSPLPANTSVKAQFAHRTVSFTDAEEPWFQELMYDSYRVERPDFNDNSSGNWSQMAEIRRQMPVVGVRAVNRRGYKPYQIGGGQYVYQDLIFYIFGQNPDIIGNTADIIANQNDKTVWIPNRALMKADGRYPFGLDYKGTPNSVVTYPQIVASDSGFRWRKIRFTNSQIQEMEPVNRWLHRFLVRTTCEVIMPEI